MQLRSKSLAAGAAAFLLAGPGLPLQAIGAATGSAKFIPTFLVYYGAGPSLVASDAQSLAKFDLLDLDRFRFGQMAPNTWSAIKSINPNVQIYLYELGPEGSNFHDATSQLFINDIGRYDVSRGHSMGSLNGDHPDLFLTDSGGNRLYSTPYSNPAADQYVYLMDFGSTTYRSYWLEAVNADIVNQPWVADGIFADNCIALHLPQFGTYSSTPADPNPGAIPAAYPDNTAWSSAMNSFASAITAGLQGNAAPQKLWCNRGETRTLEGSKAWAALDASASPPDAVMEEGAFAVLWGPAEWAVQFLEESEWKLQVDTLGGMWNSKVAALSHTKLAEPLVFSDNCGTDNWGKPVCYWQTLWYSLGSFLISKNNVLNNSYFMFHGGDSNYSKIIWHDEYDKIDLGKALGFYGRETTPDGANIYSKEFEKGYVYVNPTPNDAALLNLPQPARQLAHDNLDSSPDSIPIVDAISLNSHNAAILLKTTPTTRFDQTDPSVTYTAGWLTDGTASKRPWSEGSGADINTAGAQTTFTFTGTSIKWIGARGPWGGIARVFLDGTLVAGSVDTYASTERFQQDAILFSATGLPPGTHSLRIEVTGTRNGASTDTIIAVDAFDVTP
jgi:putative glycosyl hydrolase-like family 15 (GHL15) protein